MSPFVAGRKKKREDSSFLRFFFFFFFFILKKKSSHIYIYMIQQTTFENQFAKVLPFSYQCLKHISSPCRQQNDDLASEECSLTNNLKFDKPGTQNSVKH